jgi:hypothetical protein
LALDKCGLFDDDKLKENKFSGVLDQNNMVVPCAIMNFYKVTYSQENDKIMKTKQFYLAVGNDVDKSELH